MENGLSNQAQDWVYGEIMFFFGFVCVHDLHVACCMLHVLVFSIAGLDYCAGFGGDVSWET